MVYFRYASAFLFILGFAIILQQGLPNLKNVVKSSFVFILTSGLSILPLYIYIKIASSQTKFGLVGVQSQYANLNLWQSFLKILQSASTMANIPGVYLQPEQYLTKSINIVSSFFGLICLIIICLLLILASIKDNKSFNLANIKNNLSFSIGLIPICVFLLLLLSNLTSGYDYVGTFRYYTPAIIPIILLSYELATVSFYKNLNIIKYAFLVFILVFLGYNLIIRPVGIKIGKESVLVRLQQNIISTQFKDYYYEYPSNKLMTLPGTYETSLELEKLQKQNPEAIFLFQFYPYYLYEGKSLKMRPIPVNKALWNKAYVDGKTLIFWEQTQIEDCPYAICAAALGGNQKAIDKFSDGTITETVFESSKEKTKIIKTYFPEPTKVAK